MWPHTFLAHVQGAVKTIDKRLEESAVAVKHLEQQLFNVACDDLEPIISAQLVLPLLQVRARGCVYLPQ